MEVRKIKLTADGASFISHFKISFRALAENDISESSVKKSTVNIRKMTGGNSNSKWLVIETQRIN